MYRQKISVFALLYFFLILAEGNKVQFEQQIQNIRSKLIEDPFSHPGTTFQYVDCDQYTEKKQKVVVNRGKLYNMVRDYFDSRCDYYVEMIMEVPNSQNQFYYDSIHFINPNYARENILNFFKQGVQIYNHIPGIVQNLSQKHGMVQTLKNYDKLDLYTFNSQNFHFQTYVFDIYKSTYSPLENEFFKNVRGGFWIIKDPTGYGGNGMKLYRGVDELKKIITSLKNSSEREKRSHDWFNKNQVYGIVQRYLENPFLINGYQAQQRRLVLIASVKPFVILAQPATSMICSKKFDLNFTEFNDLQVTKHINNLNIQSQNPGYEQIFKQFAWTPQRLYEYMETEMGFSKDKIQLFNHQANLAIAYSILAAKDSFIQKTGFFQILSADFLFDVNLKPWLLQFNTASAYLQQERHQKYTYPQFIQTSYDMILKTHEDPSKLWDIWKNPAEYLELGRFEIIYNEATGYNILDQYKNKNQKQTSPTNQDL